MEIKKKIYFGDDFSFLERVFTRIQVSCDYMHFHAIDLHINLRGGECAEPKCAWDWQNLWEYINLSSLFPWLEMLGDPWWRLHPSCSLFLSLSPSHSLFHVFVSFFLFLIVSFFLPLCVPSYYFCGTTRRTSRGPPALKRSPNSRPPSTRASQG